MSLSTVHRLVRLRELRAVRISPRKMRIRPTDLDAYLNRHRTDARPLSRRDDRYFAPSNGKGVV